MSNTAVNLKAYSDNSLQIKQRGYPATKCKATINIILRCAY